MELGTILDDFEFIQYTGDNGQEVLDFYDNNKGESVSYLHSFILEENEKLILCEQTPDTNFERFIIEKYQYLMCFKGRKGFIVMTPADIINMKYALMNHFNEDNENDDE